MNDSPTYRDALHRMQSACGRVNAGTHPRHNYVQACADEASAMVEALIESMAVRSERSSIYGEIDAERARQDTKFGWIGTDGSILPGLDEHAKVSVLTEEVGEVARAVLEMQFGNATEEQLEAELIQVAAVAVAWLEARRARKAAVAA